VHPGRSSATKSYDSTSLSMNKDGDGSARCPVTPRKIVLRFQLASGITLTIQTKALRLRGMFKNTPRVG